MNYFQLLKRLYDIYDRNAGKEVDSSFIIRQIRRQIPFKECTVTKIHTLGLASNMLSVSGVYDAYADKFGGNPITIEISFPKVKTTFCFNENDLSRSHWSEICINFMETLGHEFMHLNQFRRRKFQLAKAYKSKLSCPKRREFQEYYGDPDEIDAYAFVAAADLAIQFVSSRNGKIPCIEHTRVYEIYTRFFDNNDPVIVKLVKLTQRYYKRLERQYYDTTFE